MSLASAAAALRPWDKRAVYGAASRFASGEQELSSSWGTESPQNRLRERAHSSRQSSSRCLGPETKTPAGPQICGEPGVSEARARPGGGRSRLAGPQSEGCRVVLKGTGDGPVLPQSLIPQQVVANDTAGHVCCPRPPPRRGRAALLRLDAVRVCRLQGNQTRQQSFQPLPRRVSPKLAWSPGQGPRPRCCPCPRPPGRPFALMEAKRPPSQLGDDAVITQAPCSRPP